MLKKNIKYVDYNGVERSEDFYFNLSQAEIMEMQLSKDGGLSDYLQKIIDAKDVPTLMKIFKDLVLKAYGEKSDDGRRFVKIAPDGHRLADDFAQTEAYSIMFMELATDADAASKFVTSVIPADLASKLPANV